MFICIGLLFCNSSGSVFAFFGNSWALVFSILIVSLFLLHHSYTLSVSQSENPLGSRHLQLSYTGPYRQRTNSKNIFLITSITSFMYKMKKVGPRTLPCGTP